MTLTQLEYILAVDELRHFGKAASSCHVTQPTLSMQIQKLEDQLDVTIFDRSKSPVLVTNIGQKIIKQARKILHESNLLIQISQNEENSLEGEFRLGVIPTLSPYLLPLFVGTFVKEYPNIKLIIEEWKTEEIMSLLEKDKLDAALLATPLHLDSLIERVLFYEPFLFYSNASHPLSKKRKIKESDLGTDGLWLLKEGHCLRNQTLKACHLPKTGQSKNLFFESGNLETIKRMVESGEGHTLLPLLATIGMKTKGGSALREFSKPIPTREVSLVHSRSFLKEKIIDVLEQVIINSLPKELPSHKKDLSILEID